MAAAPGVQGASSTTNGESKDHLALKKNVAAQKLGKMARTLREEQDEQKRAWMALRASFTLIDPYPPCVQDLDELEEMTVAQLRSNVHHRGKFVWLTKFSELLCFRPTNMVVVVNDRNLDSKFMEIMLADQKLREHGLFPPGTVMALKEPFYTMGEFGENVLRVDHLSDIVTLPLTDDRVPTRFNQLTEFDRGVTALQWKERGNDFIKKNDYAGALNAYTMGLTKVLETEEKLRCDLHRNRAQAQLMLGRYRAAQEDAGSSLCGVSELDVKAKFRIAQSYYERTQFEQARKVLEESTLVEDRDSQALLRRVNARQREEELGDFDFDRILKRLSKHQPRADAGSYLKKVEVRTEGALAGRGLFAVVDMEAGDIVLCSKPLCSLFVSEPDARLASKEDLRGGEKYPDNFGLWRKLVNTLEHDPDMLQRVSQLQAKHVGLGDMCLESDGKPVIDVFQIHDILSENKHRMPDSRKISPTREFGIGVVEEEDWEISGALWDVASYINHSCLSNAYKVFIADMMLLRAVRPIKAGEEITLSYINLQEKERQEYLRRVWSIECQCVLCNAERSDGTKTTQTRQKASVEFVGRNEIADITKSAAPSNKAMQRSKALAQQVSASYDTDTYAEVPRLATLAIATWTVQAHYLRSEHDELFRAAREFFLAMGYTTVSLDGENIVLQAGPNAILPKRGIDVLQMLAKVKLQKGDRLAATSLERFAKRFYTTMNGLENGYKTINPGLA